MKRKIKVIYKYVLPKTLEKKREYQRRLDLAYEMLFRKIDKIVEKND